MVVRLYTVDEAATELKCDPYWLVRSARRGTVPSRKVGRQRLFTESDLEAIVERSLQGKDPWARPGRSSSRRPATDGAK